MKTFMEPEYEVVLFRMADIITQSPEPPEPCTDPGQTPEDPCAFY